MSLSTTNDDVTQRVLEYFRGELCGLQSGWFSRTFIGCAPIKGYARQFSDLDARGQMTGNILGTWCITHTEMVPLETTFTIPAPASRSGMYYDRGTYDFVVAPDCKSVVVGWQVGPRFGRGFQFDIITNDNGHIGLKLTHTLWKS
ncbi:MAG: hypothetical protein P4N60_17535 [Verrucomicrobiae bacterium]|nr:hypothetical protein [Verrucomicrobiae bacterium]